MQNGETAGSAVRYETKTIQAVRGNVGRTITKWEQQGWELVSRDDGALRSEITFRRAKRTIDVRRWALVGAGAAVVVAAVVVISVVAGGDGNVDRTPTAASTPVTSVTTSTSPAPSAAPPTATATPAADEVITAANNPQFANLLALGNYCSPEIAAFAEQYGGRTVSFPASISALNPVAGTTTRFDIGIAPGDSGGQSSTGPAFQFRDVNTVSDLNFSGDVPGSLGVGTLLGVVAEVESYNPEQCLFLLDPVETSFR